MQDSNNDIREAIDTALNLLEADCRKRRSEIEQLKSQIFEAEKVQAKAMREMNVMARLRPARPHCPLD
jgi:hypothetical protein